jgi:hypothetical protein
MSVDPDELAAAQAVVARAECHAQGHDFGVATDPDGAPVQVVCSRPCGHGPWPIADRQLLMSDHDQGVQVMHLWEDVPGPWPCCGALRLTGDHFTTDPVDVTCTGSR